MTQDESEGKITPFSDKTMGDGHRDDKDVFNDIWEFFTLDPELEPFGIHVTVLDGKVTLTGTVNDNYARVLAETLAAGVPGVRRVENRLAVLARELPSFP